MNPYFVLHIDHLSSAGEDWLSQHAFESGALGISEVLPFSQPEGEEDVFTEIPAERSVQVYFESTPPRTLVESLRGTFPDAVVRVTSEESRDWLAEWKKGFKPFPLTRDHWVVPSWCEAPAEALHQIRIDPGMAFGTGTHETTQLVAGFLETLTAREELTSCLDVGTGTGILILLARQLGLTDLRATEIEEDSRRVARQNFAANDVASIRLDETQVEDLTETFSVVVANIIDGVLVRLRDALLARVGPGGWLVVSGIYLEREPDFLAGFRLPDGKAWDHRVQKGNWLLFALRL